jgi:hypothetical protein
LDGRPAVLDEKGFSYREDGRIWLVLGGLVLEESGPDVKSLGRNPIDSPIIMSMSLLDEIPGNGRILGWGKEG